MNVIDQLLSVQEHDARIRRINQELTDIPARQKAERTRLEEHQQALAAAEEQLKKRQSDLKQLELEADGHKARIEKLRQQQLTLKTNKEFKVMEGEIASTENDIKKLEDREITLMEQIENAREDVRARQADLAEEEEAVVADCKELDERATELKAELTEAEAARAEAATGIDAEWLTRYDQIWSRRDSALVEVRNGVCGGCHMRLPPSAAHDARKRMAMVTCDFCGRMLYA